MDMEGNMVRFVPRKEHPSRSAETGWRGQGWMDAAKASREAIVIVQNVAQGGKGGGQRGVHSRDF